MVLRHRDRELLRFEWVEPQGVRVVSVNDAERKFLPLEMHGIASDATRLEKLKGFRFKRHKYYNLPVDRLHKIEDFLQKRVSEIIEYGVKADGFLSLSGKECTVNHANGSAQCTQNSDSLSEQIKQNIRVDPFITKIELSEILQVSPRWIARKMKDLQSAGEIRRVGADKNGHWEVVSG